MNTIVTKIILVLLVVAVLVLFAIFLAVTKENKLKKKYGPHYNEVAFATSTDEQSLVTTKEYDSLNIDTEIRYKGYDLLSKHIAYCQGLRCFDEVFLANDPTEIDRTYTKYTIVTELRCPDSKETEIMDKEALEYLKRWPHIKAVIKVSVMGAISYLYLE